MFAVLKTLVGDRSNIESSKALVHRFLYMPVYPKSCRCSKWEFLAQNI